MFIISLLSTPCFPFCSCKMIEWTIYQNNKPYNVAKLLMKSVRRKKKEKVFHPESPSMQLFFSSSFGAEIFSISDITGGSSIYTNLFHSHCCCCRFSHTLSHLPVYYIVYYTMPVAHTVTDNSFSIIVSYDLMIKLQAASQGYKKTPQSIAISPLIFWLVIACVRSAKRSPVKCISHRCFNFSFLYKSFTVL